jgi:Transmembrane proteins 14C
MNNQVLVHTLCLYGAFLILCGIISVIFIGLKAKTALISGGTSGSICLLIAYLIYNHTPEAKLIGVIFNLALFIVFAWRATKTLFSVFDMIEKSQEGIKGKGIAFLIISLMAVVSLVIFGVQIIFYLNS